MTLANLNGEFARIVTSREAIATLCVRVSGPTRLDRPEPGPHCKGSFEKPREPGAVLIWKGSIWRMAVSPAFSEQLSTWLLMSPGQRPQWGI
jgi:hypothetical protein